jgi:glutamine synthetase
MNEGDLRQAVSDGSIDTVLLAITDMQGRLQGKRMAGEHFVADVIERGAEACNYLLAVDVEMNTVGGYASSSWSTGYGDFELRPDLATLRAVPWQPATALCLADIHDHDGSPVAVSPRQILKRQLERLAERGWSANAATELEFIVFEDSYEQAWDNGYTRLTPANRYNVDYSLLGTARVEPLIRRIRNEMAAAGLAVEASKGECNAGQHEINFRYRDALRTADDHAFYKNGAKEIAAQEGMAITFMAKYDEREGNSCHVHLSLGDGEGGAVFEDRPEVFDHFVSSRFFMHRTSTPTSASPAARSRRPRWLGAWTTAPARCARSATARRGESSAACRAPTSTRISRSAR